MTYKQMSKLFEESAAKLGEIRWMDYRRELCSEYHTVLAIVYQGLRTLAVSDPVEYEDFAKVAAKFVGKLDPGWLAAIQQK